MSLYLDAAASTPLHPKVLEEMNEVSDIFGNPNSRHVEGFRTRKKMDEYLQRIADIMGTSPAHLVVTHGGTEGNRRVMWAMRNRFGHKNLFCSEVEHLSLRDEVLETNRFLPDKLESIPADAPLISNMIVNNETGRIFDMSLIRKKFPQALIFSDWVQGVGRIDFSFEDIDFATFSAHKFHGPKGVGVLWIKNPEQFPDLSRDTHTKDIVAVAGMARAFELLSEEKKENLKRWTEQIETFVEKNIPDYKIHEKAFPRSPGMISLAFKGVRGSELMAELSEKEAVCVSTGAACTADLLSSTHVICAIEKDPEWQHPIRLSLHSMLTDEEISEFCEILAHYVQELRKR